MTHVASHVPITGFPPNVPQKLIRAYHRQKDNQRALARHLKLNPAIINKLLKYGIEPTNPDIRVKLFLKRKYRKPIPEWVKQGAAFLKQAEEKASCPSATCGERTK